MTRTKKAYRRLKKCIYKSQFRPSVKMVGLPLHDLPIEIPQIQMSLAILTIFRFQSVQAL